MATLTSILIVDDEPAVRDLMARWATSLGLESTTASCSEEALERLRARHHDLAVIDVMMPGQSGMWLAGEMRRAHPNTAVVIATAYAEMVDDGPIADLLIKPFKRERFELAVDRGRQWRQRTLADGAWHAHLVRALAHGIEEVRTIVAIRRARAVDDEHVLVELIGERTPDVLAHSERVSRYSVSIAQELKLDAAMIPLAARAARLHDLGKIAMPQSLLAKPSPMTDGEIDVMRRHADAGAEILGDTPLRDLAPVVRSTHEWFGGGGYPARLVGARIPFLSRVIAVADAYDAMTQRRAYRNRLDAGEAVNELRRCSTSQFDPAVVAAFLTVLGRQ